MKIFIALGGNALGDTSKEQKAKTIETASALIPLIKDGHELIISHGNGPQIGKIFKAFEKKKSFDMSLPESGGMSQGYIGFHLEEALENALKKEGIKKHVVTILSRTLVDFKDPAFQDPTKPIGKFLTKEEAEVLEKEGISVMEDSGRGYRRVVPSPEPIKILEEKGIKKLVDSGFLVICGGGGGIPTIEKNGVYQSIPAVIDKDKSSAKLAASLNCDLLIILTAVDEVFIHYGTENEKALRDISVEEALSYMESGEFGKGSMEPKIEACLDFLKNSDKQALITSSEKVQEALDKKSGTWIYN